MGPAPFHNGQGIKNGDHYATQHWAGAGLALTSTGWEGLGGGARRGLEEVRLHSKNTWCPSFKVSAGLGQRMGGMQNQSLMAYSGRSSQQGVSGVSLLPFPV